MNKSLLIENLKISYNAIQSNLLRSILTISIIAIGIIALIGILTATEAIKSTINNEFTRMGANSFSIQNREMKVRIGKRRSHARNFSQITYRQASEFKKKYDFPATVSISVRASWNETIKFQSEKTNPNIAVVGTDENFISTSGFEIEKGRNFSELEVQSGRNVTIIGSEIAENLFKKRNPIGKIISVGQSKCKVIGVLKSKGSGPGFSDDKSVIISLTNARQYYSSGDMSYSIAVLPNNGLMLEEAIGEAEGKFRIIRKLALADDSDFSISKSDNLVNMMLENISYVTVAATIIGIITLFGAAIGLMNIMLVSVSERTREIGTRKAIGATSQIIKQQFLFESILIGQIGGIIGIILGILIGNIVSFSIGSAFVVPWGWVGGGFVLCFMVGIFSGLMPAIKASKLDPIEALRYE